MRGSALLVASLSLALTLPAIAARAADIGACLTPEAMTAVLKTEDQHSVANADLLTSNKHLFGLIFTMSGDGKSGYIIRSDKPMGERAGQLCVYNRMADVRLFDARRPGVPPGALLKAPEADALRRCDELDKAGKFSRKSCGSLNTMLRLVEPRGERVVLTGFLVDKDKDGRYAQNGTLATLTGRIGGSINDIPNDPAGGILGGLMYSSLPDGASILNAVLVYVEYTPYGFAALR